MPIIDITLPKLGESVAEATILKWLKVEGDTVERDENLAEVATDKVDTDLPSEYQGVLRSILVKEGEVVKVGAPIARIEIEENQSIERIESSTSNKSILSSHKGDLLGKKPRSTKDERTLKKNKLEITTSHFITPVVRNIAAEAGLTAEDLLKIKPTGSNGSRITKKDILSFLNPPIEDNGVNNDAVRDLKIELGDEVIRLSRMRKLIANHMSSSVQTAAHVTSWVEADVTDIVAWREENKQGFFDKYAVKVTYTHLFIRDIISVLKMFPKLNAWLNGGDALIIKNRINLGFATATKDDNLIVPNLKNAASLNLYEIAKGVSELGAAARNGKLKPYDIEETTFTVSNTGIYGSLMGTPILSLPQVGVLALGEIVRKPSIILEGGVEKMAIRNLMYLSLSYDHRIIDGAYASQFLRVLKDKFQHFRRKELV